MMEHLEPPPSFHVASLDTPLILPHQPSPARSGSSNRTPHDLIPPSPYPYPHINSDPEELGPAPTYTLNFTRAYQQFLTADEAQKALDELEPRVKQVEQSVTHAKAELGELKNQSAQLFSQQATKRRPKRFTFFRKSKDQPEPEAHSPTSPATPANETDSQPNGRAFEAALAVEMEQVNKLERLEAEAKVLNTKKDALSATASTIDAAWVELCRTVEISSESSRVFATPSAAVLIGHAEEKLASAEAAYQLTKKTTADFSRARVTIQHAHHYLSQTLQICDSLKSTPLSKTMAGFGTTGNLLDYRNAATIGYKAQVCLDEALRMLKPHGSKLQEGPMADYEALESMGVSQSKKVLDMVTGMSLPSGGISRSSEILYSKQELAFGHLTKLAVWVQDWVPRCEAQESGARKRRDEARRTLGGIWDNLWNGKGSGEDGQSASADTWGSNNPFLSSTSEHRTPDSSVSSPFPYSFAAATSPVSPVSPGMASRRGSVF